jgi:CheY-like chemotaxis protein
MSKMLFFIDDDEDFLYVLARVASKLDFISSTLTALNGRVALDKLISMKENNEKLPDTMFVDLNMPVMDGFEFLENFKQLREVHEEFKNIIPVIMLTSSQENSDKEAALKLGVVEQYIIKPSGIKNLEQMLRDLMV